MTFDKTTGIVKKSINRLYKNLGLINLFGKSFGKVMFMGLLAYLAYVMTVEDFANFAIFWATLRLFSFYGANNLQIIYFNKVRIALLDEKKWPKEISANILFTFLAFTLIFLPLSYLIFKSFYLAIILYVSSFLFMLIRYLAEFSKIDNNVFLSIFIEDLLFNILLFVICYLFTQFDCNLNYVVMAIAITLFITGTTGLILFIRKFKVIPELTLVSVYNFSKNDFVSGLNFSILRGHEVLSNFTIRYLGKVFYGSLFVAYSHVLFQFYSIFTILTISVVSGFQSKTTVKYRENFNGKFIEKSYKMMIKSLLPFVVSLVIILTLFGEQILQLGFPKYVEYHYLLVWISLAGLIFALIQPYVFIFIYNNRLKGIKIINLIQYLVLGVLLLAPSFGLSQNFWLITLISIFIIVQGMFTYLLTKNQR